MEERYTDTATMQMFSSSTVVHTKEGPVATVVEMEQTSTEAVVLMVGEHERTPAQFAESHTEYYDSITLVSSLDQKPPHDGDRVYDEHQAHMPTTSSESVAALGNETQSSTGHHVLDFHPHAFEEPPLLQHSYLNELGFYEVVHRPSVRPSSPKFDQRRSLLLDADTAPAPQYDNDGYIAMDGDRLDEVDPESNPTNDELAAAYKDMNVLIQFADGDTPGTGKTPRVAAFKADPIKGVSLVCFDNSVALTDDEQRALVVYQELWCRRDWCEHQNLIFVDPPPPFTH